MITDDHRPAAHDGPQPGCLGRRMRTRICGALLIATGMAMPLVPASASASPSVQGFSGSVAVSGEPTGPGPDGGITNSGTWAASGLIAGPFAVVERTWFGGGNSSTLHYDGTLTGSAGTISIQVEARFVGYTAPYVHVDGVWTITAGTGAYTNLHGTGAYTATLDTSTTPKTITESLTGSADLAPGS